MVFNDTDTNVLRIVKVGKGAKIRNRYNQVPHLTQDINGMSILFIFFSDCVTEFETIFRGLMFWRFLFLPQTAPTKSTSQIILSVLQYVAVYKRFLKDLKNLSLVGDLKQEIHLS